MTEIAEEQGSFVGLARVMRGATSFKDEGIPNVNDTFRGQILLNNGEIKTAILKDLAPKELANEVFAAGLASILSLPVPDAFIAIAPTGSSYPFRSRLSDGSGLMFASADVGSPSIAQMVVSPLEADVRKALKPIAEALIGKLWLADLYAFDGWIANVDRHIGNLLFGTDESAWIIDHGRCFTGPAWTAEDLKPDQTFRHRLREWLTPFVSLADRKRLATEAATLVSRLNQIDLAAIGASNRVDRLLDERDFKTLVSFLLDRIPHVPRAAGDALDELRIA